TIEDPIEFLHRDKKAVLTQREVGNDTPDFASALRSALRQDPDVIVVGEMRDRRTVEIALSAAETGHLVISTLHTVNAAETIYRISSLFPTHQVERIRFQLGSLLKAIISQRLVPRADGNGRIPALEVLINRGQVQEYIEDKDRTREITDAIAKGAATYGTQSFDQSLYRSYKDGLITLDDAMLFATNPDQFAMRVRGVVSAKDNY
ncbi:MAG TPA: type IV pili twitching motility protein PilT, partial [Deltaproteobacteria bacterium]|nr:type IV pili twitching motility protein PilT [Deltaproteobacteria bacterium]